jgi:hypothetical protein
MKIGRCPVCHAHLALDAIAQDEAARELLALLASLDADLARALVSYLGLWRPAKQDLAWSRALRLVRETLALDADTTRLARALGDAVDALRAKGGPLPLRSHGYLKRVIEGAQAQAPHGDAVRQRGATSRTAEAMRRLVQGS